MTETYNGHCLCGAIRLEGRGVPSIEICHCSMCRHWHGGPAMVAMFEDGVTVTGGDDYVATYESSDWAERAFCKTCGTTLYYQLKEADAPHGSQAGLFDLPTGLSIHEEIFVDEQPDYYRFDTDAPRLTGAEVMARYRMGAEGNKND